jgi:hypothetical protein
MLDEAMMSERSRDIPVSLRGSRSLILYDSDDGTSPNETLMLPFDRFIMIAKRSEDHLTAAHVKETGEWTLACPCKTRRNEVAGRWQRARRGGESRR